MGAMPVVSDRVRERVISDFGPSAPRVLSTLERLPVDGSIDPERIHAAVVLAARGSLALFEDAADHARDDWRDLLDRANLDAPEWRDDILDAFGPE